MCGTGGAAAAMDSETRREAVKINRRFPQCCCFLMLWVFTVTCVEGLSNVAFHKPATQSSFHPGYGRPDMAVDGDRTSSSIIFCTHTEDTESNPERWWRVDLQDLYLVDSVIITNRGDCCGWRLQNFSIVTSREVNHPTVGWQDTGVLCVHHAGAVGEGATVTLKCVQPALGRYVTLVRAAISSTDPLHFCELEVMADTPVRIAQKFGTYRRISGLRAPGDVIQDIYVRSVLSCLVECEKISICTAVNVEASKKAITGSRKACQLLEYGGPNHPAVVVSDSAWNFYWIQNVSDQTTILE